MSLDTSKPLAPQLGFDSVASEAASPPFQDAAFSASQVHDLAARSLDFLASLALPTIFKYFFPPVFQQIWQLLLTYVHKQRDFSQLAIGLPRGFAKTTFIKIFLLYVILFTKRTFILICAKNEKKAAAILADVCSFLDEPNIRKVFGDWRLGLTIDQAVQKQFGFRGRNIVLHAGTVSTVRGLNVGHRRPDVMIFDDIQDRDDAESEMVSQQIETDMYGTAMKAKSPEGCLFVFIGNMYPTKFSILRRLQNNPTWIKFVAGGILWRDGKPESLWEDLQPLSQLLKEFENDLASGRPEVFFAEVLNDPNASVNKLVDISKIPECPFENDFASGQHQGNFIIIDPATDKANADSVSIGYFEIWDSVPVCREIIEGRLSPGDSIEETLKLCFKYNCFLVAVESNAYQYSHLYWFNYICNQRGIQGINCVDVYSGQASKNSRILTMFKALLASEIFLATATRAQVFSQITAFNHLKTNNVDGILDCLTYAPRVIELYGEWIASHLTLAMQDFSSIPVLEAHQTSGF